jgi:hypothetical protein
MSPSVSRSNVATIVVACLLFASPAQSQTDDDEQRFRRGMLPIGVALADRLPMTGAEAIIVRSTVGPVHDVIILPAQGGTPLLLEEALTTLYFLHAGPGACPTENAIIRVQRTSRRPPLFFERDAATTERIFGRLRTAPRQMIDQVGLVRYKKIWIRRFFKGNAPSEEEWPLSVCPGQ